jgi:hypothetical protein
VWWQSSEAARALVHFASARGRAELWDEFDAAMSFIRSHFVDSVYGGWYTTLDPVTLAPTNANKGTVWTVGYHEAMLYAEMVRLGAPVSAPFSGTPIAIPVTGSATIQAETFDNGGEGVAYHDIDAVNSGGAYRATGVDLQTTTDTGGGHNVGWTRAGEWLAYAVDVASSGTYNVDFRVASNGTGGTFHLEVDGTDVTGATSVPGTGGWQAWKTLTRSGVALPAGQHTLRLVMNSVGATGSVGNFNYVRIGSTPTGAAVTVTTNTAAHVRDGSYAATSFGNAAALEVKKNNSGYNREIDLKFDLAAVPSIASAKLRLYGRLLDAQIAAVNLGVYASATTNWSESVTWNTRPAAGSRLATATITGTAAKWYEIDVGSYLKTEKTAGRNVVTLVIRSDTLANTLCTFNSDEAATNRPQLIIQQ